ncbi:myb-like protein X [Teleopsis dalmanni]|uniref:myb-like protein X n=1 Tax=Teleopsis dalmanni TaxID=139649 RepID=UPI0018CE0051|nr:myb-like protein X [Teleopsis dalmanni]
MLHNFRSGGVGRLSSNCPKKIKIESLQHSWEKYCPCICQCCSVKSINNQQTYEILQKRCTKIFQDYEKEQCKDLKTFSCSCSLLQRKSMCRPYICSCCFFNSDCNPRSHEILQKICLKILQDYVRQPAKENVNNPSSECAQRKKDSCKCCPHVCQCCCTTGADNWRTYEILKKICRKIFQEFEKEQSKEKYTLFGGGNSINLRIHRSSEKQPPDRKGEDPCEIEMRNKYNEPDLHKNVVLKSNIVRETQENRDEKFSKKKLTKDNLKKIDVKEKSEKRKGKDGKEEGKDEKGKNEKRKIEERKTEKKRKDEKEKGDRRKSDKWRGEREKNDKEKAEKEKGNKERSEKKKSEKEEGDKEKSEKKKGEKEKGDKEKSEKKKGEKEKGDKEKSEKKKGENEKGDKGKSENKKSEKRKIEKENPRKEVKPISKKRNSSIQNRKSISKNEKDEPKKSTRMSMLLSKQRKPKKDIENDNARNGEDPLHEKVVSKANVTQENREEKLSKKKLTKDDLKKIDVKEKSEKRKDKHEKRKSEERKTEKKRKDKREKGEKEIGDRWKGERQKGDKKKGEKEKGDKEENERKKGKKGNSEKENPRNEVKPISKKRKSSIQKRKLISKNEKDEPKKSTRMSMLLSKQRKPKKDIENDDEHVSEGNKKNVKKVLDSITVINYLRGKVRRRKKSNNKYKGEKKINVISTKHKEKPKDKSLVKKRHVEITENRKPKRDVSNLQRMDQVQASNMLRADMEERDLQRHRMVCISECNCFMPCVIPAPCNCNCIHTC